MLFVRLYLTNLSLKDWNMAFLSNTCESKKHETFQHFHRDVVDQNILYFGKTSLLITDHFSMTSFVPKVLSFIT